MKRKDKNQIEPELFWTRLTIKFRTLIRENGGTTAVSRKTGICFDSIYRIWNQKDVRVATIEKLYHCLKADLPPEICDLVQAGKSESINHSSLLISKCIDILKVRKQHSVLTESLPQEKNNLIDSEENPSLSAEEKKKFLKKFYHDW